MASTVTLAGKFPKMENKTYKDVNFKSSFWNVEEMNVESEHPVPNDTYYDVQIHHPGATFMKVHFKVFAMEAGYDGVKITDGAGNDVQMVTGDHDDF